MAAMAIEVICKGMWTHKMEEGDEEMEILCPLRDNCYRYQARNQLYNVKNYFDVVPYSINGKCDHFVEWN